VFFVAGALLIGCSGGLHFTPSKPLIAAPFLPSTAGPNLYVANYLGYVTVYAPGSGSVLRTIKKGVNGPYALAFDGSGNLYVANCGLNCGGMRKGTATVYSAGRNKLLRTISQGVDQPHALAFGP
jgi:DNA-binding beta-propeller fold protein YncE